MAVRQQEWHPFSRAARAEKEEEEEEEEVGGGTIYNLHALITHDDCLIVCGP